MSWLVLIHTYGVDTAFYEGVRGLWRPVFGDGGLWIEGPVVDTRRAWRCTQAFARAQNVEQADHSLGFIEALDANLLPADWTAPDFDDRGWDVARPLLAGGGRPGVAVSGHDRPPLSHPAAPRHSRASRNSGAGDRAFAGSRVSCSRPDLPLHLRLYDEQLVHGIGSGAAHRLEDVLRDGDADHHHPHKRTASTPPSRSISAASSPAIPASRSRRSGGEVIEIACAERLPGEWSGEVDDDARIERRPYIGTDAHLCRYVARSGTAEFPALRMVRHPLYARRRAQCPGRRRHPPVRCDRNPLSCRGTRPLLLLGSLC